MFFFLFPTAGKTKTYEEVEEMLEGGDPAIFTSDVSTESMYYQKYGFLVDSSIIFIPDFFKVIAVSWTLHPAKFPYSLTYHWCEWDFRSLVFFLIYQTRNVTPQVFFDSKYVWMTGSSVYPYGLKCLIAFLCHTYSRHSSVWPPPWITKKL